MLDERTAAINQAIVDSAACLIVVLSGQGRIIRFNKACETLTHYTFEEVKDRFYWELFLPSTEVSAVKAAFEEVEAGNFPGTFGNCWLTRRGERRFINWSTTALSDENNRVEYIIGTGIDITERKQLEEKVPQAISPDALCVKDREDRFILVNQAYAAIVNKPAEDIIGRTSLDLWPVDTARRFQAQDREALNSGHSQTFEFTVLNSQDQVQTYRYTCDPYRDSQGNISGIFGIARDITGREPVEKELPESEELFRLLVEDIEDYAIFMLDPQGKVVSWNRGAEKIKGYPAQEIIGQSSEKFYTEQDKLQGIPAQILATARATGHYTGEGWRVRRDGSHFWASVVVSALYEAESGRLRGFAKITRDISERINTERQLKIWADIFQNINLGVVVVNPTGQIMEMANKAVVRLLGYEKAEELVGQSPLIAYSEEFKSQLPFYLQAAQQKGYYVFEPTLLRKDGTTFPAQVTGTMVRDEEGLLLYRIVTVQDITARRQSEEALKKSEELYRTLVQNIPDAAVLLFDQELRFLLADGPALLKYGYTKEYVQGKTLAEALSPDSVRELEPIYRAALDGTTTKFERSFQTSIYYTQAIPVKNPQGEIFAGLLMILDITELKQAEKQIKAALLEKEVLLKEVHHRVKNNLQVISSLLKIQATYIKEPFHREIFKESQNRIRSMALVHEQLYKSKDLTGVNIGEYLEELVSNVSRMYATSGRPVKMELVVDKDLIVDLDTAIPCGLIVNELITNSFKHAFPNQAPKGVKKFEIGLTLCVNSFGLISLTVKDNGKGLPVGFDLHTSNSLGLKLVSILVKQLDGTIEVKSSSDSSSGVVGTEFGLTFPFTPGNSPRIIIQP